MGDAKTNPNSQNLCSDSKSSVPIDSSGTDKLTDFAFASPQGLRVLEDEKKAAMKQLAYGASHEINNPLGNIASRAQLLAQKHRDHPELHRQLAIIYQQAMRAHEMISDMMLYAHPPALRCRSTRFSDFVEMIASQHPDIQINLTDPIRDQEFDCDPERLVEAIGAIIQNGIEALSPPEEVRVTVAELGGDQVLIRIDDAGTGISEETRRHLFDPFYSGREAGRGLGFGLPKAQTVAELHGGTLDCESKPGVGSSFSFQLPKNQKASM